MRIRRLDFGLESISRWRLEDENHLPAEGRAAPQFQPKHFALDRILRRPSLDERLIDFMQPATIASDLLEPGVLSATRHSIRQLLESKAQNALGPARITLAGAATLLGEEVNLDKAVQSALVALLKG